MAKPKAPRKRSNMAPADHALELIRLRAKRVNRCERSLTYTRDAYRDALNTIGGHLGEYELTELSPDQEPAAVLEEIRRLAHRRSSLEASKATDLEARKGDLDLARKRLAESIFDDQLDLFGALADDRQAVEAQEPTRLRVDDATGALVPFLEASPADPPAKPSRGRRASP